MVTTDCGPVMLLPLRVFFQRQSNDSAKDYADLLTKRPLTGTPSVAAMNTALITYCYCIFGLQGILQTCQDLKPLRNEVILCDSNY